MENRDYVDPNKLAVNIQESTPDEKTEINLEGQNFEINISEIFNLLEITVRKYFRSIDYNFITSPQNLLSYFYFNEKECIMKIKDLKDISYSKKKFYKGLIYESISEEFSQSPEKLTKPVFEGIEKIRETLYKKEKSNEEINLKIFYTLAEDILGTKEVPKFLVRKDIKYIKFRENYKNKEKKRPEFEEIIEYYKKIKQGQLKPFDYIYNKSKLFDIFVISNSKEILKNDITNKIFLDNYNEILSWFNLDLNTRGYDYVFSNFIKISSFELNGLLENLFIPLNIELDNEQCGENLYLILISSFFYCILHKMKDTIEVSIDKDKKNKNCNNDDIIINLNNSRITKFLTNVANVLISNTKNCKYSIKILINELYRYIMSDNNNINNNENNLINQINSINNNNNNIYSQEENIDYDFKMIEELILGSDDNNLKERFKSIKSKLTLEPFSFGPSFFGIIFKRVVNVITSQFYYYANFIRLSPFQRYISSNVITILISGFGSENDIHSLTWRKYIETNPYDSNYYFYHWPGDSLAKIVIRSLPWSYKGLKLDSDLPQVFLDAKKKAIHCGKMLAIILKSNLFFQNRQINLVAFSLGNHVVKHCLKELSNYNDAKCIINDVTFIAGATTFKNKLNWYNRFNKIIGGRIVNCYSEKDWVLDFLYSNCTGNKPIGSHKIDINDGIGGKNLVENYDFTDLNMGHLDYRNNFDKVIQRINS